MEKNKRLKLMSKVIFFGAIWGITEATLGFFLHFLPPTIAGLIMFPVAVFILVKAYKATGSKAAIVFVGLIAAGIKAVDLLLPGMMVFKTINPMISIVLESLLVAVAYPLLKKTEWKFRLAGGLAASIGWRMGYIFYMVVQYLISGFISKYISTAGEVINFIIINGLISGLLTFGVLSIEPKLTVKTIKIRPVYAVAAFAIAMTLQLLI